MKSRARRQFWNLFRSLPVSVQKAAKQKYQLWRNDPAHPSLHFKELRPSLWSIRITDNYRALALRDGESIVWFWIGKHGEYDRLIQQ
ncbi:MAG TPA: hypothetical protein VM008_16205 [Phycisphaerae bacterium]|nr:hypothetical protein [Phycisphaerae bacterium]